MHTVHHTDAVILKSLPLAEANRRIWLYTKDFGLVVATVQGVRKQGAKLQSQLTEYAFISADLVRGKDVWRLISAVKTHEPLQSNTRSALARSYVRLLATAERFLLEEGAHPEVFDHIAQVAACIAQEHRIKQRSFDAFVLWKMLALLGYIAPTIHTAILLQMPLTEAVQNIDESQTIEIIKEANDAIKISHL